MMRHFAATGRTWAIGAAAAVSLGLPPRISSKGSPVILGYSSR